MADGDDLRTPEHCEECGYDLRARPADKCPECGTTVYVPMGLFGSATQASGIDAAFAEGGIDYRLVRSRSSGLGTLLGQSPVETTAVHVARGDYDRAAAIMEQHGLAVPLPIVDVTEPVCPSCSGELEPGGPEECPHCEALFRWVDVSAAPVALEQKEDEAVPADHRTSAFGPLLIAVVLVALILLVFLRHGLD